MDLLTVMLLIARAWCGQPDVTIAGDLIRRGKLADARLALERALKTNKSDPQLWNLLGILSAQQNEPIQAERAFRRAVSLAPGLEPAWLNLGRLYQLGGTDERSRRRSIEAYRTVLRLNPQNAEANHQLALLLQLMGDYRGSLVHLDRLPPEDQERLPALLIRCASNAGLGRTEAALTPAEKILRNPSLEEADLLTILGTVESHDEVVAAKLLEGLEDRRLASAASLKRLAALYEKRGDWKQARAAYERAARAGRPSAAVLLDLARVAWKQKDYEGTLGYLAHARDLDPNDAGIHFFFGITCNELKLPQEAKESVKKALDLAPDNPYYNYAMGAIQLQWLEKDQAIPYLKKFVALRPEDARGRLALATAYFGALQDDEAKAQLSIAARNPETRAGAEYLLGRIATRQGNFENAVTRFRALIELEPKSADAHAELADALFETKDVAGARRETEIALSLEPANYVANRTLLRIYRAEGDSRVKEQAERIQKIVENRDARLRAMQRNLVIRPY
jgi:tetratricopeptide (TPR) repeat protein